MMLKRKIEKEIMHWIESSNKALLIYGVRQAGKTFIMASNPVTAGGYYFMKEVAYLLSKGIKWIL